MTTSSSQSRCPFAYLATTMSSPHDTKPNYKSQKYAHQKEKTEKPFGLFTILPFYGLYLIINAILTNDYSCQISSLWGLLIVYASLRLADTFIPEESNQWVLKRRYTWCLANYIILPIVLFSFLEMNNGLVFVGLAFCSMTIRTFNNAVQELGMLNGTCH